jgi:hypothetical protein
MQGYDMGVPNVMVLQSVESDWHGKGVDPVKPCNICRLVLEGFLSVTQIIPFLFLANTTW